MIKKNITAVITLVSKNKECYLKHSKIINNLLDKYQIESIQTKKLSQFVKDFLINIDNIIFERIKTELNTMILNGSDLCIQNNLFRKKKIMACDMDGTAISIETIDLIGEKILKNDHISELTEEAMNGKVNFNKSIIERTKILRGISIKEIKKLINNITLTKDIVTVVKTLNNNGCYTILISGGYNLIANIIGDKIGFNEVVSNVPKTEDGKLTGKLEGTVIDGKGKLNFLKKKMKLNNENKYETIAVGDGQNDIDMIKYSGLGASWRGFPNVNKVADARANYSFKSILYFQGYSDSEISF